MAPNYILEALFCAKSFLALVPPPTFPRFPRMLNRAVSHPPSFFGSLNDDECSFSPFSKRKYLLAQMRQTYELIDSLLKQVRLSHILLTKYMRDLLIILSHLSLLSL